MIALLFVSCSESTNNTKYEKYLGFMKVKVERTSENGSILGKYYTTYYLEGIKAELLSNGKVVETTEIKDDPNSECLFVFEKIETDKEFTIRATIDNVGVVESNPFIFNNVHKNFVKAEYLPSGYLSGGPPLWFQEGEYYNNFSTNSVADIVFDLNDRKVHASPNPFSQRTVITFELQSQQNVKIEILDVKGVIVDVLIDNELQAGQHSVSFQLSEDIPYGIYFVKIRTTEGTYFRTLHFGVKGGPVIK